MRRLTLVAAALLAVAVWIWLILSPAEQAPGASSAAILAPPQVSVPEETVREPLDRSSSPEAIAGSQQLAAPESSMTLRLLSDAATPIPGLAIDVMLRQSPFEDALVLRSVVADLQGLVHVVAPFLDGEVTVRSVDPSWMAQGRWVGLQRDGPVDCLFSRSDLLLKGRVTSSGGIGIAGATVSCRSTEATTDGRGYYQLSVVVDYCTVVTASKERFLPTTRSMKPLGVHELVADFVLEEALLLRGVLVDEGDLPVPSASITGGRGFGVANSSGDGTFAVWISSANRAFIVVADGFPIFQHNVPTGRSSDELLRVVVRSGGRVDGAVMDESGLRIAHAAVEWTNGFATQRCETGASGEFRFSGITKGGLDIRVHAAGFVPVKRWLPAATEPRSVEFRLTRGGTLSGVVLGGRDRRPLHGAVVRVMAGTTVADTSAGLYGIHDAATADAEGRFSIADVAPVVAVEVSAAGHDAQIVHQLGTDSSPHTVCLDRSGRLRGQVVDAASGTPIREFLVRMVACDLRAGEVAVSYVASEWMDSGITFLSEDGRWNADQEVLKLGALVTLQFSAPGYQPNSLTRAAVGDDTSAPLQVRLNRLP